MKLDVIKWIAGSPSDKRPSKETLNHTALIKLASGYNPFLETPQAYKTAYESLGIDIINIVPLTNAPKAMEPGEIKIRPDGVQESYLGVFNSTSRIHFPYNSVEKFFTADIRKLSYKELKLPGAQYMLDLNEREIEERSAFIGDIGLYYYQLYTTLFMWGVEALGWDIFLMAAVSDTERFDKHFLTVVFEKTKSIILMLSNLDNPIIFCHDDIAMSTGPIFNPTWYHKYIFPRYKELWKILHDKGKKVFFVSDGNIQWALQDLRESGCDGIMFESAATDIDAVIDIFGDKFFIGGIDAKILTFGAEEDVHKHTKNIIKKTLKYRGFALCCSGGLNGNMPLANLEKYFDTRAEYGYTKPDWRKINSEG